MILLAKDTGSILADVGVLCGWCSLARVAVITCAISRCNNLTGHTHIGVVTGGVRVVAELLVHNFTWLVNVLDSRLSRCALLSTVTPLLHRI